MPSFEHSLRRTNPITVILAVLILCAAPATALANPAAIEILKKHGCPGCHVIPGIPEAVGTIGPTLKGVGERPRIASGSLRNTPENMRRWLSNPKSVRTTLMPNTGLTDAELDILIKYLDTL